MGSKLRTFELLAVASILTFSLTSCSASNSPFLLGEGSQVADALEQVETDPLSVYSEEAIKLYGDKVDISFPKGTTIATDASTWNPTGGPQGEGVIEIAVTFPDGEVEDFVAFIVREDNQWKISGTAAIFPEGE